MLLECVVDSCCETAAQLLADRGEHGIEQVALDEQPTWRIVLSPSYVAVVFVHEDPRRKVGIQDVRAVTAHFDRHRVILASPAGATPFLATRLRSLQEEDGSVIEVFRYAELVHNITRHSLVPPHTRMTDAETSALLSALGLSTARSLPQMFTTDPVCRYYGWDDGTVVRIVRNELQSSGIVTQIETARVVVQP